jgi:hypothetical protein
MPYATPTPTTILQADHWSISNIQIDPAIPSVTYQVRAMDGETEVKRDTVSAAGAELLAVQGFAALYATMKTLLYADAMARGLIPETAEEE